MTIKMKRLDRQSNVEFLRIIAMLFIVVGHIVLHGTHDSIPGGEIIKSFTVVGVNLFVMISGYFSIRLNLKSFLNVLTTVVFYSFTSIILCVLIYKQHFPITTVLGACLPMSVYGTYWFVSCYMLLMLLSPAINRITDTMSNKSFVGILAAFAYVSCVSGWLFKNPVNSNGYTVFNFVFIYLIGHGIRRFNIPKVIKPFSWLIVYLSLVALLFLMFRYAKGRAPYYNNPITILAAVSLLSLVLNWKFQNKAINVMASCMFPVYLIQDGFFGQRLYVFLYEKGVEFGFRGGVLWDTIAIFGVFIYDSTNNRTNT